MEALYGLVGHPLGHSYSPRFFRDKFRAEGIDADYLNFDIDDIRQLPMLVAAHPLLRGLNVTIPYKEKVMDMLDEVSSLARRIGAVNVIVIDRTEDGRKILSGYNTDCPGFGSAIDVFAAAHPREYDGEGDNVQALVLGTGGACKAVTTALKMRGIEPTIESRTAGEGRITYADLTPEVMKAHCLVVNTTPLGTSPNTDTAPDIPYHLLTPRHIAVDVVYNPAVTLFMRRCAEQGCTVKNGFDMLHSQALLSWRLWNLQPI